MRIFTNKGFFKKLLCIVLAIIIFSSVVPSNVSYASTSDLIADIGGTLLSPIASLLIGVGDIFMNIIHDALYDLDSSLMLVSQKSDGWGIFWSVVAAIGAVVAAVVLVWVLGLGGAAILAHFGLSLGAAASASLVSTAIVFTLSSGLAAGTFTALSWFGDNVVFPMYQASPEEIFRNEIPLLDINIFKSQDDVLDKYGDPNDYTGLKQKPKNTKKIDSDSVYITIYENASEEQINSEIESVKEEIYDIIKWHGYEGEMPEINLYVDGRKKKSITIEWILGEVGYEAVIKWTGQNNGWTRDYGNYVEENFEIIIKEGEVAWYRAVKKESKKPIYSSGNQVVWAVLKDENNDGIKDINDYKIATDKLIDDLYSEIVSKTTCPYTKEDIFRYYYGYEEGKGLREHLTEWEAKNQTPDNGKISWDAGATDETQFDKGYFELQYTNTILNGQPYCFFVNIAGNDISYSHTEWEEATLQTVSTLGLQLKPVITKWYYAIRNFVLVVMMIILLYIGIRIILCSVASEKAKYKNMLTDWVVAICLVFIMHYIMVFAMNLVDGITNIFATVNGGDDLYSNTYEIDKDFYDKLKTSFNDNGLNVDDYIIANDLDNSGKAYLLWDSKNLLGHARVQAALTESGTLTYVGFGVIFLILVFYTVFFLFTYIKRALYLTFFTIIAPLVAMTYPIDKLHDGKAQAFNMWFKEYIFNLAIQPVHLLLYTVLISSAFQLSSSNMVYSLVAIGFMMPAEKFIRKMFGFDKAQTPGFLGGAAGAALAMAGVNKLFHRRPNKGAKGDAFIDDGGKNGKEDKINIKDDSAVNPFLLANGSGVKQKGNNISNILSNEEKQRQAQIEKDKMQNAVKAAQTYAPGTTNPYMTRNTNNNIIPTKSDAINKQFQSQNAKFKKAEEAAKKKAESRKNGFWAKQGRGIKAATKAYTGQKLRRFGYNLATGKSIRSFAKTAGGLTLGATGALLGGTLGIASGDIGKVGQYGATGAVGGYALGARDIKTSKDMEMAYAEYERAQYENEKEYRKHLLEEQRKAVEGNEKNQKALRTYLKLKDEEDARKKMEEYGEFIDAGITDMEDFATAVRLVEDNGWEKDMAITASKYYKKAGGKPKNMNKRDRENIEYQYKNIARANGVPEEELDKTVNIMLKNLDIYGSTKDDLTQI